MFNLHSSFTKSLAQEEAVNSLTCGIKQKKRSQVLLGITGSGKTFSMANIIEKNQKQTLVLAHNKTLAAQLYQEFKSFFPENAVEYFVSYYDYYQPEAYIARTDTYIEKDLAINDKIEKMRLSATKSLIERKDVIVISSVSCIYGLGTPEYYATMITNIKKDQKIERDDFILHLIEMQYKRNDYDLLRASFRVRGDILEIVPAYEDDISYRIEFFGEIVERITKIDPLTGQKIKLVDEATIYPASHHVIPENIRLGALSSIKKELKLRESYFEKENKLIEKQRIKERTLYDIEMIKEIGFCKGIENYSLHFSKREQGEPPSCLLDYFEKDYLMFIDESHQTMPQVKAMYKGDRSRKQNLIDFGFRLESAYDNRPLKFEEFINKINQVIYVSATPAEFEINEAGGEITTQIIRPTGLLDPKIEIKPLQGQVDDVLEEISKETKKNNRVLVTTLTKKLAEELTKYLQEIGVKAKYIHSNVDTLDRIQIIKELRKGKFDVLVGINLLREGLDIPEVSLVAILDADKEGFLRSETALIQTCGRASRNIEGRVVMYADKITNSIKNTIEITQKRRELQSEYNKKHNIIPTTIVRAKTENLEETFSPETKEKVEIKAIPKNIETKIKEIKIKMKKAAKELRFEDAASYRDDLKYLEGLELLR